MNASINTTANESQIERANAMFAKCPHMSFERHLEIIVKQDSKKGWQKATNKSMAKQASLENVANMKEVHLTVDGVDYGSDMSSYNAAIARKMMNIK